MSRDYQQHGWRHAEAPIGTDPSPAGHVDWAYALGSGSFASPSAGVEQPISFSGISTDNPGLFTLEFGTGGFSAIQGLSVAENGVYRMDWVFQFTSATTGDALATYYTGSLGLASFFTVGNDTLESYAASVTGDAKRLSNQTRFWELMFVGGDFGAETLPTVPQTPWAASIGGHSFDVSVGLIIERKSRTYVTDHPGSTP